MIVVLIGKEAEERRRTRERRLIFLVFFALLQSNSMLGKERCEAELCDSRNEITIWLRASSSSFPSLMARREKDTRSFALINNSVNEQIV